MSYFLMILTFKMATAMRKKYDKLSKLLKQKKITYLCELVISMYRKENF